MKKPNSAHILRYLLFSKEPIGKAIKRVERLKKAIRKKEEPCKIQVQQGKLR